ncbi:MAG: thioredoxin family protein [bacterium]
MARTLSRMPELGMAAPGFALPDVTKPDGNGLGKIVRLGDFAGAPALLVMFICNHCPFVKHVRGELARLGRDYIARGVGVVGISSNDAEAYPVDGPALMASEAAEAGYTFAYLYDQSQEVAMAYQAACTPDFFLFDKDRRLVYRGQLDDSRPGQGAAGSIPVTGASLRAALDAVLAGRAVPGEQLPSMGCNIKWKSGNEPVYALGA